MLISYVRDKDRVPRGVVVAEVIDGQVRYGWALCPKYAVPQKISLRATTPKRKLMPNKQMNKNIAVDRMFKGLERPSKKVVPLVIDAALSKLAVRAGKYFKQLDKKPQMV